MPAFSKLADNFAHDLVEELPGGYVCCNNGRHWVRGHGRCPVCDRIEEVRDCHEDVVRVYGYVLDQHTRLLAICAHSHVFYTSIYMMKNIVACGNLTKQPVSRHNPNCHNHVFSEYVYGVEDWSKQSSIKIKRILQLMLHYISIGGLALDGKVFSTNQILWQDDICPVGNVIACSHDLRYIVTYKHDSAYVDVSAWCLKYGYCLIEIEHYVSSCKRSSKKCSISKNINLKTMCTLAVGLHDAGILKSYSCNDEEFLERFITKRHQEFTELGTKIIEKDHSIFDQRS
jgi:hypothetical protein